MNERNRLSLLGLCAVLLGFIAPVSRAQWLTQSFHLVPGWNAIYLHVDPSYASLDDLISSDASNPITEVWLWKPASVTGQSIQPPAPTGANTQWSSWKRALGPSSLLQRVFGNSACLVHVGGTAEFTWNVKGRPVPPSYSWTSTGLNFIGFPTPPDVPPSFDRFLSQSSELYDSVQVFRYVGGDLGSNNPELLQNYLSTPLNRGEAVWIRSPVVYNRYFGPFSLELQNAQGLFFGDTLGQFRLVLRNALNYGLKVNLQAVNSEAPPPGETAIAQAPPLLIRGVLNTTNLTYSYKRLDSPQSWTLAPSGEPGSAVEIVFGVDRSSLAGEPGTLFAGALRFTDEQLLSRVDLPVSATVSSSAGLWVGQALVTQVGAYLKSFQKAEDGSLEQSASGAYITTSTNTSLGGVARPFPLRLIVHHDGTSTKLLQRVYLGTRFGDLALATGESLLDATNKAIARRISSASLPWSAGNAPWAMTGTFALGSDLAVSVPIAYDDQSSNPFLHTYHPDHDNLDALFGTPLPRGEESYLVTRSITLHITAPPDDFSSLTSVNRSRTGTYDESITVAGKGTESRQFAVRGLFSLNRTSPIATLTTDP